MIWISCCTCLLYTSITVNQYNNTQIKLYKNGKSKIKNRLYIIDNDKKVPLNEDVIMCYDKCK